MMQRNWGSIDRQRARVEAARRRRLDARGRAEAEIGDVRRERGALPVHGRMHDSELRLLAELRAEWMAERLTLTPPPSAPAGAVAWINTQLDQLGAMGGGRPMALRVNKRSDEEQVAGMLARLRCPLWWRRRLRREAVRLREAEALCVHEVCASRRQVYVSSDTVHRRIEQNARNAALLEATEIESADGEVLKLSKAVEGSVSNRAIRRGELMTRIVGCERFADAAGDVGLFVTATAPSRFHATLRHGAPNPKWRAFGPPPPDMPRRAQKWLCSTWARARSAMHRAGVGVYGFRVAEPHHDGTPHWHMLVWCAQKHAAKVQEILRSWWLKDDGTEPGAREHRLTVKAMEPGGASGYVAKYIAKGIDDHGAVGHEGHRDDYDGEAVPMPAQDDMFGGLAQRVEAWASCWGIRQFQAMGQPPVTVWRELRRIDDVGEVLGASPRLARAWRAVHRDGDEKADWQAYLMEQGGVMNGGFRFLDLALHRVERLGRYETTEQDRPLGVRDRTEPDVIAHSSRREWRPRGGWGAQERRAPKVPTLTRTRFNNCSRRTSPACFVAGRLVPRGAPLMTWRQLIEQEPMVKAWEEDPFQPPGEQPPWTRPPIPTTATSCRP